MNPVPQAIPHSASAASSLTAFRIRSSPLAAWHLLSLDAPTVAVLWTVFTARLAHIRLPIETPIAMGLAVWALYAADRLLDTRHLVAGDSAAAGADRLEARHFFHHRHRRAFLPGIACAACAVVALLPFLAHQAIPLYSLEAGLLAAYFVLVHPVPSTGRPPQRLARIPRFKIPKELLVGPFFSAATFIPVISRDPAMRASLLPDAMVFAILCVLNGLFIHAWEQVPVDVSASCAALPAAVRTLAVPAASFIALSLTALSCALAIVQAYRQPDGWQYPAACGISAAALLVLDRCRGGIPALTLRAAADAALLSPLLFLAFTA